MKKCIAFCLLVLVWSIPVAAQRGPQLKYTKCPFFIPYEDEVEGETLDCATLTVLEDHSKPDGKTIDLAVVVIYSTADEPAPDPVVYLEGGPGGSALSAYDGFLRSALRAERDIIMLDQRGTGYSKPSLNCWEYDYDSDDPSLDCYNRLVENGVDLSTYHSAQSALDVAALISTLNYDEVNLWGISYGTRLALTIMRDTNAPIRSVILDGVYPPQVAGWDENPINGYKAFEVLFANCAADRKCNEAYPDLEMILKEAVTIRDAEPMTLQDEEGNEIDDQLTGDELVNTLYSNLYDSTMIRYLPAMIYAAHDGDAYNYSNVGWDDDEVPEIELPAGVTLSSLSEDQYNRLWADFLGYDTPADLLAFLDTLTEDELASRRADFETAAADSNGALIDDSSEGFYNTVECYEEVHFNSLERGQALLDGIPENIQEPLMENFVTQVSDCALWNLPESSDLENKVVTSDLPVLVMSGEYDPVTPASWGQSTADALPNSFHFVIPGMGHGVVDNGVECPTQIALDFLNDPATEPDSSCIAKIKPTFYIGDR